MTSVSDAPLLPRLLRGTIAKNHRGDTIRPALSQGAHSLRVAQQQGGLGDAGCDPDGYSRQP